MSGMESVAQRSPLEASSLIRSTPPFSAAPSVAACTCASRARSLHRALSARAAVGFLFAEYTHEERKTSPSVHALSVQCSLCRGAPSRVGDVMRTIVAGRSCGVSRRDCRGLSRTTGGLRHCSIRRFRGQYRLPLVETRGAVACARYAAIEIPQEDRRRVLHAETHPLDPRRADFCASTPYSHHSGPVTKRRNARKGSQRPIAIG